MLLSVRTLAGIAYTKQEETVNAVNILFPGYFPETISSNPKN